MPSSITLTVKQLPASTSFFLSALQPLDYVYRGRVDNTIGFGTKDSPPDFWISQETPGIPAGAAHVAFPATSRENVQDFFVAGIKAGGKCHGEPLLRDPASGYFSAAIIDFDGNSIEAVYRPDLVDEGYGSRPGSVSSVSSNKSKPAMSSKAPTMISKASTSRPPPTDVRSVPPSQTARAPSKAPSQVSRAPTQASKAVTSASRSPTHVSKAPSAVSRTPSQTSRAPTSISRAQSYSSQAPPPQQFTQQQTTTHTTPSGEVVTTIMTEARGAMNFARDLVNQVRPALDSSNSAPNIHGSSQSFPTSDPNSHKPSDTIVGTLLGVAAGAALHYAYTKATEGDKRRDEQAAFTIQQQAYRPPVARTNTEPSYADERMYYYHEYNRSQPNQPYAIEAPLSEYAATRYEPSRVGSQRYITMEDNDEHLSDFTKAPSTVRPRRRSSFSGVDVRSFASQSRASQLPGSKAGRMLEAPPTSYRAPTAITMAETERDDKSRVSERSRSKSRVSSVMRSASISGDSKASKRSSRRNSDEDLRSATKSHTSRRSSRSRAPSEAESEARTVIPINKSPPSQAPSKAPSQTPSKAPSRAPSRSSTIRPEDRPLPPSRAGTTVSVSPSEYHSTHSKANKTVIGKMLERERAGGRNELTKSVVGKIEDSERLNVTDREVDPSDSVSQVSSVRSKRSSRK